MDMEVFNRNGEIQIETKTDSTEKKADVGANNAENAGNVSAEGGQAVGANVQTNNEDNQVASAIGAQEVADEAAEVETSALTDDEKAQLENARAELAKLNDSIKNNNSQLNNIEYQITVLQDKIEENLNKAIDKSNEIAEKEKEKAKEIVTQNVNAYVNSNGKMTYEEFMENLSGDLDKQARSANSKLSSAIRRLVEAESNLQH